jgi:hypothetical protein
VARRAATTAASRIGCKPRRIDRERRGGGDEAGGVAGDDEAAADAVADVLAGGGAIERDDRKPDASASITTLPKVSERLGKRNASADA